MKIKTQRILILIILAAGIIWNCICILNILPLSLFTVSAIVVGGYSFMIIVIPLLFPGIAQVMEKSAYIHDLTKREKQMSYAMICLAFAWVVTLISCIVSPL